MRDIKLTRFTWIDKLYWSWVGFMALYVPFAVTMMMTKLASM